MSVTSFLPKHVFGAETKYSHTLLPVDEHNLVYIAGHSLIIHNLETKTQRFISGAAESECITALAVAPSGKHLAVAEKSEKGVVTVYDLSTLKRRKVLSLSDSSSKEVTGLSFSSDSRLLAVQNGAPDWNLVVWHWERAKLMGSARTANGNGDPITQVTFSPNGPSENNLLLVTGLGVFRAMRAEDLGLKTVQHTVSKRESTNFLVHAWLSGDRIVVGTDAGELLIVDTSDLKTTLHFPGVEEKATVIVAQGKGFVVGTKSGNIHLFEREDEGSYKCTKTYTRDDKHSFKAAASLSDESLVFLTDMGELVKLSVTASSRGKGAELKMESLSPGFQSGELFSMSGCLRKPLVAATGEDRHLRLWNYQDRTMEFVKGFSEEPFSLSLHPSGLSAVIGFADKLRVLTLLMDDVRTVKELPIRACRAVAFSHGGHLFAAVNVSTICIYNSLTCAQIGVLRGHGGKVRCLAWSADDQYLTSAGMDGAVYEWSIKEMKRNREHVLKGCNYSCVAGSGEQTIYLATDDKLKVLQDDETSLKVTTEVSLNCGISQIALPSGGKLLFVATTKGTIRAYRLPLSEDFQELHCSPSPITQLTLSDDHSTLFAANSQGVIFVFAVKDKDTSRAAASDKRDDQLPWATEVLLSKASLEEVHQRIAELEAQAVELELAKEYALRVKDMAAAEQASAAAGAHAQELKAQKQMLFDMKQEMEGLLSERDKQLIQTNEKHQAHIAALEVHNQEKIAAVSKLNQEAAREASEALAEANEKLAYESAEHDKAIQELADEMEARIKDEQDNQESLQLAKEAQEREFELTRGLMEEITDEEIEDLRAKYESRLSTERDNCVRLQGENGLLRQKFQSALTDVTQLQDQMKVLETVKNNLQNKITDLEAECSSLKSDIRERDAKIHDRDQRISALKAESQQLAKFKFVLEYKLDEVKGQLEPKEAEIEDLNKKIEKLEDNLQVAQDKAKAASLAAADMKIQQQGLRQESQRHLTQFTSAQATIRLFQKDLQEIIRFILDPAALKAAVKTLYQKHCSDKAATTSISDDIIQDYERRKAHLRDEITTLKAQLKRSTEQGRAEKARTLKEQNSLLGEIANLRGRLELAAQGGMQHLAGRKSLAVPRGSVARPQAPQSPDPDARRPFKPVNKTKELKARLLLWRPQTAQSTMKKNPCASLHQAK